MWTTSIRALNEHLADGAPSGFWYGQVDMNTGARTASEFGALNAFFPAVLVLAGDVKRARRLEQSCFKMWNLAGIEPEVLDYREMKITSPGYQLRPEIMESAYYLWRATHDPRYREMGRAFFDALSQRFQNQFPSFVFALTLNRRQGLRITRESAPTSNMAI